MCEVKASTQSRGPNCPGVLSPGKANVGIIPAEIFSEGVIGLVSRSGTLTYQIGHELTQLGLGNSTIVGIGGDPVVGSSFVDVLERSRPTRRRSTSCSSARSAATRRRRRRSTSPSTCRSRCSPTSPASRRRPGKTMGHAGAIISGSSGTAQAKKDALEAVGITVGTTPTEVAQLVAQRVGIAV